ncbi:MAG: dihydroorotase, partial [Anaerolineae bacterium]
MEADLVIGGATIVSPTGRFQGDLLVRAGKVAGIVAPGTGSGADLIDATGLYLLPGGVDAHVHMQDPGLTEREDFISGTSAAAVGGITTIVEHNRSLPFVINAELMKEKAAYLSDRALIDFAQLGGAHP